MPVINIESINIDFPKDPYPCQIEYMKNVIRALNRKENALLESPTGTGKTLCLLCATLAWQKQQEPKKINIKPESIFSVNTKKPTVKKSIILYASRTHSQLAQVIKELKTTDYKPKMTVLGSRDQLCINTKLKKLSGSSLNNACNNLVVKHSCFMKNNLDSYNKTDGSTLVQNSPILDIEDLVNIGKTDRICPYYYSRSISNDATLILLPYNYLFDSSIRNKLSIDWEDAIVILDEAHNVEKVASDSASFSISSTDIAKCIEELQNVIKLLKDKQPDDLSNPSNPQFIPPENDEIPNILNIIPILKSFFEFEKLLDEVTLTNMNIGTSPCYVADGIWLKNLFEKAGFTSYLVSKYIIELSKCVQFLLNETQSALSIGDSTINLTISEPKLSLFLSTLPRIFRSNKYCNDIMNEYKVFINYKNLKNKNKTLNFWCFSPGISLLELKTFGVRSIIMTSGTLSPLGSFKEDMKLLFPIELENSHIIQDNQVWIGALSVGMTGKQLNSSFTVRESSDYKDELGLSILAICETMIGNPRISSLDNIPIGKELNGGILIFFPSYNVLDNCVNRWKDTGLYNRLISVGGSIVIEQSGTNNIKINKNISNDSITNQNKGFNQDETQNKEESTIINGIIGEFESSLDRNGRCILLAVCRGKVSEGIDFRDNRGRVVIITGIPYSPHLDPWIILKKQYLDEKINRLSSSSTSSIDLSDSSKNFQNWINQLQSSSNSSSAGLSGSTSQNNNSNQSVTPYNNSNLNLNSKINSSSAANGNPSQKPVQYHNISNSSQNSNPNNKNIQINISKSKISGAEWYHQSAIRAVNQAIGRVIRHRSDWGAIFLLDDRYLQEKQKQYLSKWIRPKQKNYQVMSKCLQDFRKFISEAMDDPRLTIQSKVTEVIDRRYDINNMPKVHEIKQSTITREVYIKSSDLSTNKNEETSFIAPELLSTQYQSMKPLVNTINKSLDEDSFMSRLQNKTLSQNTNTGQKSSQGQNSLFGQKSSNLGQKINPTELFERKSKIISNTKGSNTNISLSETITKQNNSLSSYPFEYENKVNISNIMNINDNNDNIMKSNTLNNKKINGLASSNWNNKSNGIKTNVIDNKLSSIGGFIKESLKPNELIIFKQELKNIKSQVNLTIENITIFIDKILQLLLNYNIEIKYNILNDIKHCIPLHLKDDYDIILQSKISNQSKNITDLEMKMEIKNETNFAIKNIETKVETKNETKNNETNFETINKRQIKPIFSIKQNDKNIERMNLEQKSENETKMITSNQFTQVTNITITNSNNKIIPNNYKYEPSKRAKLQFSSTQINETKKIILNNNIYEKLQYEDLTIKNNNDKIIKCICQICKELCDIPLAARCGHICCENCWINWLNKKLNCPICRMVTTKESLSKMKIIN